MNGWLIIFGFLAGIVGGMGMGGGVVLVPLLTIFLGVEQVVAQGVNLICFFALACSSLFLHAKNGLIEKKNLLLILISASAFSVAGALLASVVNSKVLKICFGVFLIVLSVVTFVQPINKKSN
jgi:uncharacterized membrane protein YfcA